MLATPDSLQDVCADVTPATDTDAVDGVHPRWVARPGSTQESARLLQQAAAQDLAVVVRGAGTKLRWGNPPERVDLLVDTTGMDAVVDHAAGDLVAVVQAGCRLAALQQALAPAGQQLAIDETYPGATVGGTIAANASGPRRMLNGTTRDLLIGITVVRADGVIARSGGRVVKNVAGYDLGKLLTGSFGTLGLITEATFRLHPLPKATSLVYADASDATSTAGLAAAVLHSAAVPTALEIDWPATGRRRVAVLLEGTVAGVQRRTRSVRESLAAAGATEIATADEQPPCWGRYPWTDDGVGLKLTVALSAVGRLLAAVDELRAEHAPELALRGSAGAGVLYAGLPAETGVAELTAVVDRLRPLCTAAGGSLVVLAASAEAKAAVDGWGPVPALALMRAVKDQFDPEHRLSPGRFVGGI